MDTRINTCRCVGHDDTSIRIARDDDKSDIQQNAVRQPRCSYPCKNQHNFTGGGNCNISGGIPFCWILGHTNWRRGQWLFEKLSVDACMSPTELDTHRTPHDTGHCRIQWAGRHNGRWIVDGAGHRIAVNAVYNRRIRSDIFAIGISDK